jgi:hypothetical protein
MREHKEGNADGSVKESTGIVGGSLFGIILTFDVCGEFTNRAWNLIHGKPESRFVVQFATNITVFKNPQYISYRFSAFLLDTIAGI